jgi:alkylhydroperoxidase family enzyme
LEQAIHLLAVADELAKSKPEGDPLPQLSTAAAWLALPAGEGKSGPLPGWARTLAWSSPRTTAALIQLEQAMRVKSPVDAKLRAKVRWACARQTGSRYGEVAALADLLRAGGTAAEVAALTSDWDQLPAGERTTLRFARKLTAMGSSVTDAEFEAVRKVHGDTDSVGLVLTVAYSNFQDRLVLALGTPAADGELPVPAVTFKTPYVGGAVPPRDLPADPLDTPPPRVTDPAWLDTGAESLRRAMTAQTARPPRVRVPTFDELKASSPPGTFRPGQTVKINWSLAATGHQPELARAWLNCLRAFGGETQQSTIFEESAFWVVTRSVDCFY